VVLTTKQKESKVKDYSMVYRERIKNRFHGKILTDKFSFSCAKCKSVFTCKLHGDFTSTPDGILKTKYGCPICARKQRGLNRRISFKDFKIRCSKIHNNQYSYVKIDKHYVYYICMEHGIRKQRKYDHLQGKGCKCCGFLSSAKQKRVMLKQVIPLLIQTHNHTYTYKDLIYARVDANPTIIYDCPVHGEVRQDYQNHRKGKGCPLCNRGYLNKDIETKTLLYVIYFTRLNLWKLGVTIHTVKHRFSGEPEPYIVLYQHTFGSSELAYKAEADLAGILKPFKYYGRKVIRSGNTELYTQDITEITTKYLGSITKEP